MVGAMLLEPYAPIVSPFPPSVVRVAAARALGRRDLRHCSFGLDSFDLRFRNCVKSQPVRGYLEDRIDSWILRVDHWQPKELDCA